MTLPQTEISTVVCPADLQHVRQSEASIIAFDDARLLLAYTDFYDGKWYDQGPARIMGKWSHDWGQSWSEPFVIQENIGRINVMEASLLRLPSGRVLLSFLRKDVQPPKGSAAGVLHPMLIYSDDDCRTWSEPVQITRGDAYWCSTNDRLIRLSTGRILLPVDEKSAGSHVWLSDDDGITWRRGAGAVHPPDGKRYAEPTVVELSDGRVDMYIRNDTGFIHVARSADHGDTWTLHNTWGPPSPYAPCMVKRLPGSPDLLLIWCQHSLVRTNLTAAISRDHGQTWEDFRLLEEAQNWPMALSHTYPSLTFAHGCAHMTYWETHKHPQVERMFHLIYRRLPIAWFYEKRQTRAGRAPVQLMSSQPQDATIQFDGEKR